MRVAPASRYATPLSAVYRDAVVNPDGFSTRSLMRFNFVHSQEGRSGHNGVPCASPAEQDLCSCAPNQEPSSRRAALRWSLHYLSPASALRYAGAISASGMESPSSQVSPAAEGGVSVSIVRRARTSATPMSGGKLRRSHFDVDVSRP